MKVSQERISTRSSGPTFALIAFLLSFLPFIAFAEEPPKTSQLSEKINAILEKADGTWAVEVVSLKTGETLYEKNSRTAMIPASNMKLFTTAAALFYLGPDFTVKTSFYFDGNLDKQGVLHGNLIIYGRGDPNISGRFTDTPTTIFETIAESLKASGLRTIDGDIVGDDSYFDGEYYGPWPAEESYKWYAARVSALSFNDNCIDLYVSPGKSPGARAHVVQSPKTSYVRVSNKVTTTSKKNNEAWISPLHGGTGILVGGKISSGKEVQELWFPVQSPPLYTSTVFKETLERAGIKVTGTARRVGDDHASEVPYGAKPIYEHTSLPLSESIKVINKRSQNLHAELLLKQLGLHKGSGPTFDGGVQVVRDFVRKIGIDSKDIAIHDASGLSRSNRLSAHAIAQLLQIMYESKWSNAFRDSLAVAGVDKSLEKMVRSVPEGSVQAKTGSLKNVLSLSGFADGKTETLAFSIIVNGFEEETSRIRHARDRICAELIQY